MSDTTNESEAEETQSKREKLVYLIRKIALKKPEKVIAVPEGLRGFGKVTALQGICIGLDAF